MIPTKKVETKNNKNDGMYLQRRQNSHEMDFIIEALSMEVNKVKLIQIVEENKQKSDKNIKSNLKTKVLSQFFHQILDSLD